MLLQHNINTEETESIFVVGGSSPSQHYMSYNILKRACFFFLIGVFLCKIILIIIIIIVMIIAS